MIEEPNRFDVGPAWCLYTMLLVAECPHCAEVRAAPRASTMTVIEVNRARGTVTLAALPSDPEDRE